MYNNNWRRNYLHTAGVKTPFLSLPLLPSALPSLPATSLFPMPSKFASRLIYPSLLIPSSSPNAARGSGECCRFPQMVRESRAAKPILVHYQLKSTHPVIRNSLAVTRVRADCRHYFFGVPSKRRQTITATSQNGDS